MPWSCLGLLRDAARWATLTQERDARVLALSGVTVIELSERGVCVPAVCCQLRDYGAQVTYATY